MKNTLTQPLPLEPGLKVISEIGLDMTRWPTGTHCASWLGLCPGNKLSGGKRYRMRSKPTANRAASALRLAAQGLVNSHSALGASDRRMRARLGAPKAIEFIPLSFWYDAPLTSQDRDRRHDPWQVY